MAEKHDTPESRLDTKGTPHAIDVQDLHKSFGDNEVLTGIDFNVDNGQVVCVIGPSGSGKSTLLHCLAGILAPESGQVWLGDDRIDRWSEAEVFGDHRMRIGISGEPQLARFSQRDRLEVIARDRGYVLFRIPAAAVASDR